MHKRRIALAIIAALIVGLWTGTCWAEEKPKKVRHPLSVLHAALDREYGDGLYNVKYKATIWLRNVSHDDVDGIKCRLLVREGAKKYFEETKELDTIKAGKRVFVNFKWEDQRDYKVTPEIWITYTNDEGSEVEFQAFSPTWE